MRSFDRKPTDPIPHEPHGIATTVAPTQAAPRAYSHHRSTAPVTLAGADAPVVQRKVKERRGGGKAPYFSTLDVAQRGERNHVPRYFERKEDAEAWDTELAEGIKEAKEERDEKKATERQERLKRKREEIGTAKLDDASDTARIYDRSGGSSDVPIFTMTPKTAKSTFRTMMDQRRTDDFTSAVVKFPHNYHIAARGTDIGLTALVEQDVQDHHVAANVRPFERAGRPPKYPELARGLDAMVNRMATASGQTRDVVRERVGRDLERMTRASPTGNQPVALPYTQDDLIRMEELATVLRLDKARVPDATGYIRDTIVSTTSFTDLLGSKRKYAGAGQGGVERLRGKAVDDGDVSEGSDMERDEVAEAVDEEKGPDSTTSSSAPGPAALSPARTTDTDETMPETTGSSSATGREARDDDDEEEEDAQDTGESAAKRRKTDAEDGSARLN